MNGKYKRRLSIFRDLLVSGAAMVLAGCGGEAAPAPSAPASPSVAVSATSTASPTASVQVSAPATSAAISPSASAAAPSQPATGSGSAAAKPAPTTAIAWSTASSPPCTVNAGKASYTNGRTTISSFLYKPQGNGPFPAVLVLHTRGGLNQRHEPPFGQYLSTQGYVALVPDYFTPEGITPAAFEQNWSTKADAVREDLARGLDCLKSLPYVAPGRLGSVGFSLGGYWNVMLATRDDVKGVVNWYGAYAGRPVNPFVTQYAFSDMVAAVKAPILMLHGDG
ncbi:MAG TPA: dienelactone hydrolase family protein, partial [Chloroflexota bacterium]|nr:dienelactone hydrolase family protein [Chloroflexota bacterium]